MDNKKIVILIQSADQRGILAKVTSWFYGQGFNVLHCQQHTDDYEHVFFMRLELDMNDMKGSRKELADAFGSFAKEQGLNWSIHYSDYRSRVALMVS